MKCEYSKNISKNSLLQIKSRKIKPQNIVKRLQNRELYGYKKPGTQFFITREFHQSIFPNCTIVNVEKPPCFLRKFSPDGQLFIAFSADQKSLEIYKYNGPAAAGDLLQDLDGEYFGYKNDDCSYKIRSQIFNKFFKEKFTVEITQGNEQLNRECSLFTDDSRYLIVGSAAFIPEELRPHFYQVYSNNEALTPNPRSPLEDYSLHLIDLQLGKLCDTKKFPIDKIFLSHNQGLYLYKDILAVLSVQHQTIYIYHILDGMLILIRKIGRFCYENDQLLLSEAYKPPKFIGSAYNQPDRPFREYTINALKHKMLIYLFKEAQLESQRTNDPTPLRKFYQYFDLIRSLRIWKMQLLDKDHILIKYASEDVCTLKSPEPNSQTSFLMFYNMNEYRVLAMFKNTSSDLADLFENFTDYFRNVTRTGGSSISSQFTSSPANNLYARLLQDRAKEMIVNARNGGRTEAIKRILGQLPISAQSYSTSPYLDFSLFSYNDKWVSLLERPKVCGEYPIRFYGRDSGLLKFRIYAGVMGRNSAPTSRRLVAFAFHPTDPFAISVQRNNTDYIVNFHIRHMQANVT